MSFSLTGPGQFTSVAPAWWAGVPANCSFTATSATCSVIDTFIPGGYLPYEISFLPTAPGTVSVTATISGDQKDSNPGNNTTTTYSNVVKPAVVDLAVAMTTSHPAVFKKPLSYYITITNQGPDAASTAQVYDTLPLGVTFVSATPSQGYCYGGEWGALSCDVGPVLAGGSVNIELVVQPTAAATLTNTVSVSDWAFAETDPDYSNNSADTTVTVRGSDGGRALGPPNRGGCGLWPGLPIDDLEDGDLVLSPGRTGVWFIFNDGTGSQVPATVDGLVVPGGLGHSRYMAHSSGEGFSLWGAGFGVGFGCPYDVSRRRGIRFQAKAGGMRHFMVEVPTVELQDVAYGGRCTSSCEDFYTQAVSLPGDSWYECTIPFTDLRQIGWGMQAPFDVGAVMGVQFNFAVADMPYDLSVDNLAFVSHPIKGTLCVPIGG
jgi:uncharacterized repeat protein (TIGR01451 family)